MAGLVEVCGTVNCYLLFGCECYCGRLQLGCWNCILAKLALMRLATWRGEGKAYYV